MAEALRESRLREESVAVVEIRGALRGGDPLGALRLLDQARSRFPDGALTQEREALAIEALAKSGQRAAASQRAAAFLRAFPRSPHAADVKLYVSP
jgi:outer membrane protein assembly factor BamD (BamD/ComL family)